MKPHVVTWEGKRRFTASTPDGRISRFDTPEEFGGEGTAPTPMEGVLHCLAACSAIDVIAILERMRKPAESLVVEVDFERAEEHPKVFTRIGLTYRTKGPAPLERVEHAVELSARTFCSVSAMLAPGVAIGHTVVIED
jgi:putative redox protein